MIDLATVFVLGIAASGLTHIARALIPASWKFKKPWSCNLCMSFWTSLLVGLLVWAKAGFIMPMPVFITAWIYALASTGISVLLLAAHEALDRSGALPSDLDN